MPPPMPFNKISSMLAGGTSIGWRGSGDSSRLLGSSDDVATERLPTASFIMSLFSYMSMIIEYCDSYYW
jgi:hypothetical protein